MIREFVNSMVEEGRKGGPIDDGHGSQRIWHNGKYILYYRKVFADKLGVDPDDIPDDLSVHHIDGDRSHNDIDNLILCTRKAHEKLELLMDPHHYDPDKKDKKKE